MTNHAGEIFATGWIRVTGQTFIPRAGMFAGEDRKEQIIVFSEFAFLTGRVTLETLRTCVSIAGNSRMLRIHFGLSMLVTNDTREVLAIRRIGMTREALIPGTGVFTGEDGEELRIVIAELAALARRVTGETRAAFISIARDALMFRIHFTLLMFMTSEASEVGEGCRILVALLAVTPFAIVLPGKNRKEGVVVGEKRRPPVVGIVALLAIGGERIGDVIRIFRREIILLMARNALVGLQSKIALLEIGVAALAIHQRVFAH
jgi:hypothetical protein